MRPSFQTPEELKWELPMHFKLEHLALILIISINVAQESSGRQFRRTGIHNGNLVRTVFGNWGVIGQPSNKGPRGAWLNDNNGYIGDVLSLIHI